MPTNNDDAPIVNIEVKQETDGTYYLELTDNEGHSGKNNITTDAYGGAVVTWTISTQLANTTVSIGNIYEKPGTTVDVFANGSEPHALGNGTGDWSGTVSPGLISGTESYNIDYVVNGTTYTDDPQIQVVPPTP